MSRGRHVAMSLPRLWMREIGHFAKKSHTVGINVTINVAPLAATRRMHEQPVGWSALMLRAIALVGSEMKELRQSFVPFPWARLYEHPHSVATVVIEREWRGGTGVFFDNVQQPEVRSLRQIDAQIKGMKRQPVESIGGYRRLIRYTRLPGPLRRMVIGLILYCCGPMRARYLGTFSINSIAAPRTQIMQSFTFHTLTIFYGLVESNGDLLLQVLWDHRVMDGWPIRRMVDELEHTLNERIRAELLDAYGQGGPGGGEVQNAHVADAAGPDHSADRPPPGAR